MPHTMPLNWILFYFLVVFILFSLISILFWESPFKILYKTPLLNKNFFKW